MAGDAEAITAFQLDIKCEGLSLELMAKALAQAKVGRLQILKSMEAACATPLSLPSSVPRMIKMPVDPTKVGKVIGPKGETIKSIIAESGVTNIAVDGDAAMVCISGFDDDAINDAKARINALAAVNGGGMINSMPKPPPPEINEGDVFTGAKIRSLVPFGIFVELVDGCAVNPQRPPLRRDQTSSSLLAPPCAPPHSTLAQPSPCSREPQRRRLLPHL